MLIDGFLFGLGLWFAGIVIVTPMVVLKALLELAGEQNGGKKA
jgi:hypothetical protein